MEVVRGTEWKKPLPEHDPVFAPFWEAAAAGRLLYQECPVCGHRQFYPRPLCTACGADPAWAEASGRGTVHTYTVVRQYGAAPFADELPYVVAVIELDEGVKMLANVTDCAVDDVHVGMPVEAYAVEAAERVGVPFWRPVCSSADLESASKEVCMNATERLTEIEAIKRLKYRYMRGIDEKLWDQIEACFVPEATCAYSNGKYRFDGRDAIMKFLTESMARPTFLSSHRVHQPEIDFMSDTAATGIWALEDTVIDEQYGITIQGAAFYRDEYVKVGGEWKIKHTGYKRTYEQMQPRKDTGWKVTQRGF